MYRPPLRIRYPARRIVMFGRLAYRDLHPLLVTSQDGTAELACLSEGASMHSLLRLNSLERRLCEPSVSATLTIQSGDSWAARSSERVKRRLITESGSHSLGSAGLYTRWNAAGLTVESVPERTLAQSTDGRSPGIKWDIPPQLSNS